MKRFLVLSALAVALSGAASAHTSFLLPDKFNIVDGVVNVEGAYATQFFTPTVALPADLQLVRPDGVGAFDRVEVTGLVTRLQTDLPRHGTYRVTTGEKLGGVTTLVGGDDGQWRPLAAGEVPIEGTPTTTIQTVTLADLYISRGQPSREVVDAPIGALAIRPVTHPNQVLVADGFVVELLFNGAPFPNMPFVLYRRGDVDTDQDTAFVTGADGRAHVTFTEPGQYVLAVRHRGPAPADAGAAVRSYTTSLTFEVLSALPEYPPAPAEQRIRGRSSGRRPLN